MTLAACGKDGPVSVEGGDCKIFRDALAQACGLTRDDQRIIDGEAEAGFAACPNWKRPEKPISCEEVRAALLKAPPAPVTPAKKRSRFGLPLLKGKAK